MASDEVMLSLRGLNYFYRSNWSGRKRQVLKNISLDIYKGESFGFLGHNGAGKTTTIKNILGLVRGTGTILIRGLPHTQTAARKRVGYVPEHPYFYDSLSVWETLNLFARLSGVAPNKIADSCQLALELVKFPKPKNTKLRALSKGLNQKVAVAQAIVHEPELLILDEPFSGLDPLGRRDLRDLLGELKNRGTTIFMSSHILSDVEALCERVSILKQGELAGIIELSSLEVNSVKRVELRCRRYEQIPEGICQLALACEVRNKDLVLEFASNETAQQVLPAILESGVELFSYSIIQPSLEDIFMSIVEG